MVKNKRALITGVLGQDGSFMAELLASKGYEIFGIVRPNTSLLRMQWIQSKVPNINLYEIDILDNNKLCNLIARIRPTEIYNFAGISNVFDAWDNLDLIFDTNTKVVQRFLENISNIDKSIKFFQASSCLIFGRDGSGIQNELTLPNPIHPYGVSKLNADNLIKEFRAHFGIFCCSGIFFTHESERRGDNFFSKKIVNGVKAIKEGKQRIIKVGNLSSFRDYGYAKDYMEASYLMMNANSPCDYVIGTGSLISMDDFTKKCFQYYGLDYINHIEVSEELYRKNDSRSLSADISKIKSELGWTPTNSVDDIIGIMMNN